MQAISSHALYHNQMGDEERRGEGGMLMHAKKGGTLWITLIKERKKPLLNALSV